MRGESKKNEPFTIDIFNIEDLDLKIDTFNIEHLYLNLGELQTARIASLAEQGMG